MAVVATGQEPRLIADSGHPALPLRLVFAAEAAGGGWNAQEVTSFDEGVNWTAPTNMIPGGKHPEIAASPFDGSRIVTAYVGPEGGPGTIQARFIGTGDDPATAALFTFKDAAGADLAVADDSFGISEAVEGAGRWMLHVAIQGESATSDWWSGDNGGHWTRIGA